MSGYLNKREEFYRFSIKKRTEYFTESNLSASRSIKLRTETIKQSVYAWGIDWRNPCSEMQQGSDCNQRGPLIATCLFVPAFIC